MKCTADAVTFWGFAAALFTLTLGASPADASNFRVLHSFCKELNCVDGAQPAQAIRSRRR